jgi:osmotically-inducible protein OsmY
MLSRSRSHGLFAVVVGLAFAGLSDSAFAQNNTMFGGSGALSGASGFGNGTSQGIGTAFGSNSGTTGGALSMPANTMPANTLPSNALPGMSATGTTGTGTTGQRTGLVGQSNTRFTGLTPTTGQQMPGQNQGQNRNTGRGRGGQNQNQNQVGGANNQQQRTIRPQLVVAFNAPTPTAELVAARLSTRMKKIPKAGFKDVTVEVDGRKAILRGEVNSEDDSRMAAMMARLEPGIRSVKNELVVKEPAPEPEVE